MFDIWLCESEILSYLIYVWYLIVWIWNDILDKDNHGGSWDSSHTEQEDPWPHNTLGKKNLGFLYSTIISALTGWLFIWQLANVSWLACK